MLAEMIPLRFRLRGTVADIDDTVPCEPAHPTLVIVVNATDELTRIIVPPQALPVARELLAIGRPLRIAGKIDLDPGSPLRWPVATKVELLTAYH